MTNNFSMMPQIDRGLYQSRVADAATRAMEAADSPRQGVQELVLAPLVDQVAQGFASVLVVAMKELELHIANETRNVGNTVGSRLDTLQASFQNLTEAVSQQKTLSVAIQQKCDELAAETASLRESEARQDADMAGLRSETKALVGSVSERMDAAVGSLRETDTRHDLALDQIRADAKNFSASAFERIENLEKEFGVQQEDIQAMKSTLGGLPVRVDALVERLDRHSEALHSMYTSYTQRETELEQLVEGLTRLRSRPPSAPVNAL